MKAEKDQGWDAGPTTYELCRTGSEFASTIRRLLPESRAGWVIFLLEALEDGMEPETCDELLEQVKSDIGERLQKGGW